MSDITNNVFDTALIFEGGGMRESYTCAIANALLDNGIYFDHVYGVSAGASNAINYVSRDQVRVRGSFTSIVEDPQFGGVSQFLQHKGLFNGYHIYQEMGNPDGFLPFDFSAYQANPAQVTISGFERDTGRSRFWTKDDMDTLENLMARVRASSTLPFVMPPGFVDGQACYDGGMAEGNGILLPQAQKDGFRRFFIVRTRPKNFRKPEKPSAFIRAMFWRRPKMQSGLDGWGPGYNRTCDEADRLAETGAACVVYAEQISAQNNTLDRDVLEANYAAGYAQAQRDMGRWKEFLHL